MGLWKTVSDLENAALFVNNVTWGRGWEKGQVFRILNRRQVDQIGRIFAYWVTVYLVSFLWKLKK
jgi:hypothetical protein